MLFRSTELRKLLALAGTEAFAEADEHEQRADSPRDAEHGEEAPQLVGHDGAVDLPESVNKTAHESETARRRLGLHLMPENGLFAPYIRKRSACFFYMNDTTKMGE